MLAITFLLVEITDMRYCCDYYTGWSIYDQATISEYICTWTQMVQQIRRHRGVRLRHIASGFEYEIYKSYDFKLDL